MSLASAPGARAAPAAQAGGAPVVSAPAVAAPVAPALAPVIAALASGAGAAVAVFGGHVVGGPVAEVHALHGDVHRAQVLVAGPFQRDDPARAAAPALHRHAAEGAAPVLPALAGVTAPAGRVLAGRVLAGLALSASELAALPAPARTGTALAELRAALNGGPVVVQGEFGLSHWNALEFFLPLLLAVLAAAGTDFHVGHGGLLLGSGLLVAAGLVLGVFGVGQGQVNLTGQRLDVLNGDLHRVTQAVALAGAAAPQHLRVFDEEVVVVIEVADVQLAFHAVVQRDIQPAGHHTRHVAHERLALVLLCPLALVVLGQVALGFGGGALAVGGVLAHRGQSALELRHFTVSGLEVACQYLLQRAVNDEVGVTANRRGEVQILVEGKAEVTEVLARVLRLLHGAQQQRIDHAFAVGAAYLLEHRLIRLRGRFAAWEGEAQPPNRARDLLEFLEGRFFVDAEEGRDFALQQIVGDHLVGEEHQVLNHPARGFLADGDEFHAPVLVHVHLDLAQLEVQRTVAQPLLAQLGGDFQQQVEVAFEVPGVFGQRGGGLAVRLHLVVGQPRLGVDDAGREFHVQNVAFRRQFHQRGHRQAVLIRHQAAHAVAEVFGQHRQHPPRQVDRGGAGVSFAVQRGAFLHVVAHVGDVDTDHEVSFGRGLNVNGVVKVLGVAPVYGEDVEFTQVEAAHQGFFGNLDGDGVRLFQHVVGEFTAQAELDDDGLGFSLGVVLGPQHAHDLPEDLVLARMFGPEQFGDDACARFQFFQTFGQQQNAVPGAVVVGLENGVTVVEFQRADELLVGPLHDADHGGAGVAVALLPASATALVAGVAASIHTDEHGVAVPGFQGAVLRDVVVLAARLAPVAVGHHEAEARRRRLESPAHQAHRFGEAVGLLAGADDFARLHQGFEQVGDAPPATEALQGVPGKGALQVADMHRAAQLAQLLHEQTLLVGHVAEVVLGVLGGGLFLRRRLPLGPLFLAVLAGLVGFGGRSVGSLLRLHSEHRVHCRKRGFIFLNDGSFVGDGGFLGHGQHRGRRFIFRAADLHRLHARQHLVQRGGFGGFGLRTAPAPTFGSRAGCLQFRSGIGRGHFQHGGEGGFGALRGRFGPGLAAPAGLEGFDASSLGLRLFGDRWRFRLAATLDRGRCSFGGGFHYRFGSFGVRLCPGFAAPALGRLSRLGVRRGDRDRFGAHRFFSRHRFRLAPPAGSGFGGCVSRQGFGGDGFHRSVHLFGRGHFFRRGARLAAPPGSRGFFVLGGRGVCRCGGGGLPPGLGTLLAGRGGRNFALRGPFRGHGEQGFGHGVLFPLFWHLCT